MELIPRPWPRKCIMLRIKKRPPDRLTDEEVEILAALPEPWRFNVRLAIETGCGGLTWHKLAQHRRAATLVDQ